MKPRTAIIFVGVLSALILIIGAVAAFVQVPPSGDTGGAGTQTDFFSALFPFGGNAVRAPSVPATETGTNDSRPVPQLREVSAGPVAGATFSGENDIRFIEKETGHVFETKLDSLAVSRLSNTTVQDIYESLWIKDDAFILRFLSPNEVITNALGALNGTSTDQTVTASALNGFTRIAITPNGKSALTVTEVAGGSRIELIDMTKKTVPRLLLSSPIKSWVPRTGGTGLFLQTAASGASRGFLYEIEGQTLKKVVGGQTGLLATVSPTGRYVLFSSKTGSAIRLSLLDRNKGVTYEVPVATLATKCAWFENNEPILFCGAPRNTVSPTLDTWLMGAFSFEDSAWLIDPVEGIASFVLDLTDSSGNGIDLINPTTGKDGAYALFMNKNDESLWSLLISAELPQ